MMQLKDWNPIALAKKGLNKGLDSLNATPTTQPLVPVPANGQGTGNTSAGSDDGTIYANGEPVSGRFVDNQASDHTAQAARRTEQFSRVVASFDEDKQHLLASIVSKFFTGLAYLAPLLIGYFAGAALGDTISGTFSLGAGSFNIFTHLISIVLELSIPMLGFAVAVTFR